MNKKHIIAVSVIGLVYFSGVVFILYPMISNVWYVATSKTVINSYEESIKKMDERELKERADNADKYNADIANGVFNDGYELSLSGEGGVICYVDIPKLSIYLPVYYGTGNDVLAKGCGFVENTSLPIGGANTHSVISGHTGLPTAEMFTDLDRMEKGDMFYIHVLDRVLAYKVDNIESVYPDRIDLLNIVDGKDYVTLLTCTPYGINDRRLLVRGARVPYVEDDTVQTVSNINSRDDSVDNGLDSGITKEIVKISMIFFASAVVFVFACLWLFKTEKTDSTKEKIEAEEKDSSMAEDGDGKEKE